MLILTFIKIDVNIPSFSYVDVLGFLISISHEEEKEEKHVERIANDNDVPRLREMMTDSFEEDQFKLCKLGFIYK